jgi:hypothetical protein
MISNPRSVMYDDIVSVGRTLGLQEHIGKHHKFWRPGCRHIVLIPLHRDVNWRYVKQFLDLIRDIIPPEWIEEDR